MAQTHARVFLERFVKPLVAGGELHVGAPIPYADVERWETELDGATVELVAVSDRQRRRIIDNALSLVSQPLTRDRKRVMGRHALLHNLFHLSRRDTTVSWWTGRARFQGQVPSKRLTAWPGLRRVREEHTDIGFDELLAVTDTQAIVAALLRRTPLTQLLDSQPGAPPLHWEDAVFVLRDTELARAVAYHLTAPASPSEQVKEPSRLAAAFEQMLERAPDEADVRAVAAFLVHICALFALAEIHMREPNAKSPLISTVLAAEAAGQRPRGLQPLLALPGALALVAPRLANPPGLGSLPALAQRWRVPRAQTGELMSEPVIDALAQRLRRHLRPAQALAS